MFERGNDDGVVDGRLFDMDEKMEVVDLSVDEERLEREVDRIEERSSARHDVLRLCCILKCCVILLLGAQWPIMARGPGAMVAVEGIECKRTAELFLGGAIGARTNDGSKQVTCRHCYSITMRHLASFYDRTIHWFILRNRVSGLFLKSSLQTLSFFVTSGHPRATCSPNR